MTCSVQFQMVVDGFMSDLHTCELTEGHEGPHRASTGCRHAVTDPPRVDAIDRAPHTGRDGGTERLLTPEREARYQNFVRDYFNTPVDAISQLAAVGMIVAIDLRAALTAERARSARLRAFVENVANEECSIDAWYTQHVRRIVTQARALQAELASLLKDGDK